MRLEVLETDERGQGVKLEPTRPADEYCLVVVGAEEFDRLVDRLVRCTPMERATRHAHATQR
jgi:hypothetical protein